MVGQKFRHPIQDRDLVAFYVDLDEVGNQGLDVRVAFLSWLGETLGFGETV